MYRDYKVRLKMSMFRPIKQEDYIDVFDSEGKLVFVFDKEKTKDLFTKWCNYELK